MGGLTAAAPSQAVGLEIGIKAWQALLEEVYTTPKPGLVDCYSNGAHTDMDVAAFERSAAALRPYFVTMAGQGYYLNATPPQLFTAIRKTGMAAEDAMYRATGGVNTHKGLIFTLGVFSAAAGRCIRDYGRIDQHLLAAMQQQMTAETLQHELARIDAGKAVSYGEQNFCRYQTRGIRGEAIDGYPSVFGLALPVIQAGIREQRDWNLVKLQTLFTLMSRVEDSNIVARHNPQVLRQVQQEAAEFLSEGGAYSWKAAAVLRDMDQDYINRNISAGGCADLLATAIFIQTLLD